MNANRRMLFKSAAAAAAFAAVGAAHAKMQPVSLNLKVVQNRHDTQVKMTF